MTIILTITSINGDGYPVEAEVSLTEEKNGTVFIEFELLPTNNNRKFIRDVDENWIVSGIQDIKYGHFVISSFDKQGEGDYPRIKIRAVASFIHELQTTTFDGYFTGSRTAVEFFRLLSDQSGLNFSVRDFKEAFGWEKFGEGVHNIREFNRALNNYGYVYEPISENEIALKDRIGRDVNYMIKNAFNADGVKLTVDRSEVYTYIEGYADFDEEEGNFYEQAQLYSEYKGKDYEKLGEKKAETYVNQKINQIETLDRYLKDIVDNSVKFNLSTNFYILKDYPFAVPMLGDRIDVQDESIDLNQTAELIKIVTKYASDAKTVIGYELEFGSLNLGQRTRASIQSVSRQLQDFINGRGGTLAQSALDDSTRAMISDFKDAQTELVIGDYRDGIKGIFLVERDDSNRAVGLTSRGIVLTTSGFAGGIENNLAITPDALNASFIRSGTLYLEEFLGIQGKNGWLSITGDHMQFVDSNDSNKRIEARPGIFDVFGMLRIYRSDAFVDSAGKHWGMWIQDGMTKDDVAVQRNQYIEPPVNFNGRRNTLKADDAVHNVTYYAETIYTKHDRKNLVVGCGLSTTDSNVTAIVEVQDINTGQILGSLRRYLYAGEDTVWENITIDLGVPDFETRKAFGIKIGKGTNTSGTTINIIFNRVSMGG